MVLIDIWAAVINWKGKNWCRLLTGCDSQHCSSLLWKKKKAVGDLQTSGSVFRGANLATKDLSQKGNRDSRQFESHTKLQRSGVMRLLCHFYILVVMYYSAVSSVFTRESSAYHFCNHRIRCSDLTAQNILVLKTC